MTIYIISVDKELTEADATELDLENGNCPESQIRGVHIWSADKDGGKQFHKILSEVLNVDASLLSFSRVNGSQLAQAFCKYVTTEEVAPASWDNQWGECTLRLVNAVIAANWKKYPLRYIYYIKM